MADNKHNQDQSWNNNDWQQNQSRSRQQMERNQNPGYNNMGYGNQGYDDRSLHTDNRDYTNTSYSGTTGTQAGSDRVNYIPDNNDNRSRNRNYGNQQYGSAANPGSMNSGAYSSDYGYQQGTGSSWNNDEYNQTGNMNQRNSGWNRNQGHDGSYGNNYDREDRNRNVNWNEQRNRNYDNYGNNFGNTGYGNSGYERRESGNMYGGDTSNYGNANQGSFDRGWWDRTRDEVKSWFGDDDAERRRQADRKVSYRGKGPKDYQRSQDRIREDICDRLTDDDLVDASDIQVQCEGNEVVLTGTVSSREEKRRAEDLVESISGVQNVENRIKVKRNDDDTQRGSSWESERSSDR
jgi:osmotically-inducible protein OsmY